MPNNQDIDEHITSLGEEFLLGLEDDLDFIEQVILNSSSKYDKDQIRQIFAKVHSIKGSAGALGFGFLSNICHHFEDYINQIQDKLSTSMVDYLLKFVDIMRDFRNKVSEDDFRQSEFDYRLKALTDPNKIYRLLVVQKTKSFAKRYSQIVASQNVEVVTAANGYEALGQLIQNDFDLLICDTDSELIGGYQLIRILKMIPSRSTQLKTLLIADSDESTSTNEQDLPDYYICKDIDYFAKIRKVFSKIIPHGSSTEQIHEKKLTPIKVETPPHLNLKIPKLNSILCVDDDRLIQSLIKASLRSLHLENITLAQTGEEAINLAKANPPDLILLDYFLPDMIGPQVFAKLKLVNVQTEIPIIFLTGRSTPSDEKELKDLGALHVIAKPFDPKVLSSTVKNLWQQHWEEKLLQESA